MILDGEQFENLLWEEGLDFEFMRIDGVNSVVIPRGGSYLSIETVWTDPEASGWFFDVGDILFRSGTLSDLEFYGSSDADTELELVTEILDILENIS